MRTSSDLAEPQTQHSPTPWLVMWDVFREAVNYWNGKNIQFIHPMCTVHSHYFRRLSLEVLVALYIVVVMGNFVGVIKSEFIFFGKIQSHPYNYIKFIIPHLKRDVILYICLKFQDPKITGEWENLIGNDAIFASWFEISFPYCVQSVENLVDIVMGLFLCYIQYTYVCMCAQRITERGCRKETRFNSKYYCVHM